MTGSTAVFSLVLAAAWMPFWCVWIFQLSMEQDPDDLPLDSWWKNLLVVGALALLGVLMVGIDARLDDELQYYHRDVLQGEVVKMHTSRGDFAWLGVTIRGYNRKGMITERDIRLSRDVWRRTNVGDLIDLRK